MTGDEVRAARKRLGLTQAQLAARLGLARNTVTRWEIGLRSVPKMAATLLRMLVAQTPRTRRKGR